MVDSMPDLNVVGIVDDDPSLHGTFLRSVPVVGPVAAVTSYPDTQLLICAGRGRVRSKIVTRLCGPRSDRRSVRDSDRRVGASSGQLHDWLRQHRIRAYGIDFGYRGRPPRCDHAERYVDPRQSDQRLCDDLRGGIAGRRSGGRAGRHMWA